MKTEGMVVHIVNQSPRQFVLIDFTHEGQVVTGCALFRDIKQVPNAHPCLLQIGDTVQFQLEHRGQKYFCRNVEADFQISNPTDRELSRLIRVVHAHKRKIWFAERYPCGCHIALSRLPDIPLQPGMWITHRTVLDTEGIHHVAVDVEQAEAPADFVAEEFQEEKVS